MDTQLKKGLLDICVLKCLNDEDSYGYKLIDDISKHIEVSESTLYPILKRLEEQEHLTTYKEEHNNRLRKYYKITASGKKRLKDLKKEAEKVYKVLNFIVKEDKND